jgi:hypothetical protein
MAHEDVRRALRAMDADEVVRLRLAQRDFGAVGGITLTPEERTLVQDAANDMPEVAGFSASFLGIDGESTDKDHKGEIAGLSFNVGQQGFKWQTAVKYGFKF